jgi:hypothetical protein
VEEIMRDCQRNKLRVFFLGFLTFSSLMILNSCSYVAEMRKSFPVGDNIKGDLHREKLVFPDLEVSLSAYNHVRLWELLTFTVIPIHWDTEETKYGQVFRLQIGLLAKARDFSFDPKEVHLRIDGGAAIQPSKYLYLPHDEKRKTFMRKLASDGHIACGSWNVAYQFVDIGNTPIGVDDSGLWECFVLAFDVPPPDPVQGLNLEISGLRKQGQSYSIPEVSFMEKKYKRYDSAP